MFKLTKKADYGLIAVKHLASRGRTSCSAKEIAEAHNLPAEMLAKILQKLVRSGLLSSQHGTNGGYALARHPSTMTALEVIRAIDGPLFITSCVTTRGECDQSPKCTVREPLRKVNETIEQALNAVTISSLGEERTGLVQLEGLI
jgi:Rrf2 family protein